jgi:hypothetical protein
MHIHSEQKIGALTLKIVLDEDGGGFNPRTDYDNGSIMIGWHRRRTVGDDLSKAGLSSQQLRDDFGSIEEIRDYLVERFKPKCILPLFIYEHGEAIYATTPFGDPWDSGQVGFIFTDGTEEFPNPEEILNGQVAQYSDWANGEIHGFVVEDEHGNVLTSVGGFIGDPEKSGCIEDGISSANAENEYAARETAKCEAAVHL